MSASPRNPRRAYDADGNEIPPLTVGAAVADGYKTVMAWCQGEDCRHGAEVPLKGWAPETAVPDMALRLRCSKCGGRRIQMMINVTELYARAFGAGSTGAGSH